MLNHFQNVESFSKCSSKCSGMVLKAENWKPCRKTQISSLGPYSSYSTTVMHPSVDGVLDIFHPPFGREMGRLCFATWSWSSSWVQPSPSSLSTKHWEVGKMFQKQFSGFPPCSSSPSLASSLSAQQTGVFPRISREWRSTGSGPLLTWRPPWVWQLALASLTSANHMWGLSSCGWRTTLVVGIPSEDAPTPPISLKQSWKKFNLFFATGFSIKFNSNKI